MIDSSTRQRSIVPAWALLALVLLACGSPATKASGSAGNGNVSANGSCAELDCEGSGKLCSSEGTCVDCNEATDCADGSICVSGACQPFTACDSSTDCVDTEDSPFCDSTLGACVPCVATGDCGTGYRCEGNQCLELEQQECFADGDCSGGMTCEEGLCRQPCTTVLDCAADEYCDDEFCAPDICEVGSTRCDPEHNAVLTCAGDGDRYNAVDCVGANSCQEVLSSAQCTPWVCTPGDTRCSNDFSAIQTCDEDGLGYSDSADCAQAGQACEVSMCVAVICDADANYCDQGSVSTCNASGTAGTLSEQCGINKYCDEDTAACVDQVCTPNQPGCDGDTPRTCKADGSGWDDGTPCESPDVCAAGECLPTVCVANSYYCKGDPGDQDAYHCNATGTAEGLSDVCAGDEYCGPDPDSGNARCLSQVCTPGAPWCIDNVAGTCAQDGSGLAAGGTDCGDTSQACFGGTCEDIVCNPPEGYYCDDVNNQVRRCTDNGTVHELYTQCAGNQYCYVNGNTHTCAAQVCTPNAPVCSGNVLTTCKSNGSGPGAGGTNCGDTSQVCVQGACLDVICTPSQYFCQGQDVYLCGAQGATSSFVRTCSASYFCKPGYSSCYYDVCTAGSTICDGTKITTCLPDGSGPSPSYSVDCADTGQACEGGVCKDIICSPSAYYCDSGNVHHCNTLGTSHSVYDTCASYEWCDSVPANAVCTYDVCVQAVAGCNGEAVADCKSDGSGFVDAGVACGTNLVCDASGSCLDQAVDTIGSVAGYTYSDYLVGDYVSVATSRKLVKTEIYGTALGSQLFTWFVYEALAGSGTYNLIDQQTSVATGTNVFFASPALDVSLVAGRSYLIGARVEGSFTFNRVSDSIPDPISFGKVIGARYVADSGALTTTQTVVTSYRIYQRITTDNP